MVASLAFQRENKNQYPLINLQIAIYKSKRYIIAAKFFMELGCMKFEATHISEMLTSLPAVALFHANHSEVLSHLGICDHTSNTFRQQRWLVFRVNLSQEESVRS